MKNLLKIRNQANNNKLLFLINKLNKKFLNFYKFILLN